MDWDKFFEETRRAAGVESYAKLAPLLHVTDGAISHYRTGRSIPSAWVVAAALKIQGNKEPEKEAARIMREAAKSAEERAFWRKLGAAAALAVALFPLGNVRAATMNVLAEQAQDICIMRSFGSGLAALGRSYEPFPTRFRRLIR
jgi:hypothetical protein